ncbi:hypothetical protein [Flammeovirga sp. OC4]|uniref:hypothetical protein n=1 Tax=Flammeovirga sp. OC4 TaxID=1382345 RepID=UPI0005C78FC1|nr:hypothetical protein [Flammeovirga sp. OC4]
MKLIFTLLISCLSFTVFGQTEIQWKEGIELSFEDFQSPNTKVSNTLSSYSIQSGVMLEMGYQMTAYELMFKKNFNQAFKATFNPKTALITAPNMELAQHMVDYAQVEFDLAELYTRKIRRELFLNKKTFSSLSIFQTYFTMHHQRMLTEMSQLLNESDFGRKKEVLERKQLEVQNELEKLSDFCFDCTPVKKKKNKKKRDS